MNNTYYITQKKLEELENEYEAIKKSLREESIGEVPSFLESGDPNPDFSVFEENMLDLNSRFEMLENILKNYKIIETPPKNDRDKIQLGANVVFKDDAAQAEYKIVGTIEANPFEGKISNESPVGMAFLGKKVGDIVNVPASHKNYKILKIQYGDA